MAESDKGRVCVTGGTGFIGSWLIKRLLEDGYSVNATARIDSEKKRDLSFLTNLPGASEKLQIFNANLENPETFIPAIEGCIGVFHTAHPMDFAHREPEEVKVKRVNSAVKALLQICADSKTVKRFVLTSSMVAFALSDKYGSDSIDESSWTDVEVARTTSTVVGPYTVTKTLLEKVAFNVAKELGVDLISIGPTWVCGPFICNHFPESVQASLALIIRGEILYPYVKDTSLVHVDDVARAHIHLFEHPEAKGRYLNCAADYSLDKMHELISKGYPEYQLPSADVWKDIVPVKTSGFSNKKLLETGFKYKYGLEEMVEGAIKTCKEKGFF